MKINHERTRIHSLLAVAMALVMIVPATMATEPPTQTASDECLLQIGGPCTVGEYPCFVNVVVNPFDVCVEDHETRDRVATADQTLEAVDMGPLVAELAPDVEMIEEEIAIIEQVEDYGLFFIIPVIEDLAREYGLDVIVEFLLGEEQASYATLSIGGEVLARTGVASGKAFFEDVPVSDSLSYTLTIYTEDGVVVDEFLDVQTLVLEGIPVNTLPNVSEGLAWGNDEGSTYGVPSLYNVQPLFEGDVAHNYIDHLPPTVPTSHDSQGTKNPGSSSSSPATYDSNSCRQGSSGYNWYRREYQGGFKAVRNDATAPDERYGVLASRVMAWQVPYGNTCTNGVYDTGEAGFAWGWSGITKHNGFTKNFVWAMAADGDKAMKGTGGRTYGHTTAMSGGQVFFYTPNGMLVQYYSNEEVTRAEYDCREIPIYHDARKLLRSLGYIGKKTDRILGIVPEEVCFQQWGPMTSSKYGSGRGIDTNFFTTGKGTRQQIDVNGILEVQFQSCGKMDLRLEGAGEMTIKTRASTNSGWVGERAMFRDMYEVKANRVCS